MSTDSGHKRGTKSFTDNRTCRSTNPDDNHNELVRSRDTYATVAGLKERVKDLSRPANIRFRKLIKVTTKLADVYKDDKENLANLKKIFVLDLTMLLTEFCNSVTEGDANSLMTYLKVNTLVPSATKSCTELSRVLKLCRSKYDASGYLTSSKQVELLDAMNAFIADIQSDIFNS